MIIGNDIHRYTWCMVAGLLLLADGGMAGTLPEAPSIVIDVMSTRSKLLAEEDTDQDNRITVEDRRDGCVNGDGTFIVIDITGEQLEVAGTTALSNLLEELTLLEENGEETGALEYGRIFENPVDRIARSIRERYWNGLTRRLDGDHIGEMLPDTKIAAANGYHYLYVPATDSVAFDYYTVIARDNPSLMMKVERLPDSVTPEWVSGHADSHGLLTLALDVADDGAVGGVPFVVPGGRFNEMYGWDSYFEALGLIADGRIDLAKTMVDNFVYEIGHYGKILNANRTYYLTRSQPPFLTAMALAVFEQLPDEPDRVNWLRNVFRAAVKEYHDVWTSPPRLTDTGLSRYYGEGIGQPPEVEPGHFDAVYRRFGGRYGMSAEALETAYLSGEIDAPELDRYFTHDRSMRESGHDTTWRWDDRCADFVTVDLNSLLYRYELDIAMTIRDVFGDSLMLDEGAVETSAPWFARAERRKDLMNRYLWDSGQSLFLDYDLTADARRMYISPTMLYPLWAGLASDEQAASIVRTVIPALEMPGGLAASEETSRGPVTAAHPQRQWDYPYGWAPHQMLAWVGLDDYGFSDIADRLVYRWLYTIARNAADYNGTVPEKYDVVARSHRVFAEYGNVGTDFAYITREGFGWMNASYQVGLARLPVKLREKLTQLIPPEWLFGR